MGLPCLPGVAHTFGHGRLLDRSELEQTKRTEHNVSQLRYLDQESEAPSLRSGALISFASGSCSGEELPRLLRWPKWLKGCLLETGLTTSSICPRAGAVFLWHRQGICVVNTNCKAWRCKSCRERKLGMVTSLMEFGLLGLTDRWLVSFTFKAPVKANGFSGRLVDAVSAEKAWAEFRRRCQRLPWWKGMESLRVVELTNLGQIHFHALMGMVDTAGLKARCQEFPKWSTYLDDEACGCLMHLFCRVWYAVTGDSWVVDVREVYGPKGAASYLCKYVRKGMYGAEREAVEAKGYKRRYMATRGWPRGAQMQRYGTVAKVWKRVQFEKGHVEQARVDASNSHPFMRQVGTDMAKWLIRRRKVTAVANLHAKMERASAGGRR